MGTMGSSEVIALPVWHDLDAVLLASSVSIRDTVPYTWCSQVPAVLENAEILARLMMWMAYFDAHADGPDSIGLSATEVLSNPFVATIIAGLITAVVSVYISGRFGERAAANYSIKQ